MWKASGGSDLQGILVFSFAFIKAGLLLSDQYLKMPGFYFTWSFK
jgi:hypothetical protein